MRRREPRTNAHRAPEHEPSTGSHRSRALRSSLALITLSIIAKNGPGAPPDWAALPAFGATTENFIQRLHLSGIPGNLGQAEKVRGSRMKSMPHMRRAQFIGSAAAIGTVGAALLTQFVAVAQTASDQDIVALNGAIELERAGIKAYDDAAKTGLLAPAILKVALRFRADHVAHRDALAAAVLAAGAQPTLKIANLAYPQLRSQRDVLEFANDVERKAASTYLSIVPDFKNRQLAGLAASILGIETTHVAVLAQALKIFPAYSSAFIT